MIFAKNVLKPAHFIADRRVQLAADMKKDDAAYLLAEERLMTGALYAVVIATACLSGIAILYLAI